MTVYVAKRDKKQQLLIPESPLAREAVSEPLRDPSDIWRLGRRGVVWAGVVAPAPTEAALSWRVRGPGALRRLRVLLRRDLRRRVGGGCRNHDTHSNRHPQHRHNEDHSSNTSGALKPKDEYCVLTMCCVEPQLWPRPGAAVHNFEVTANYKLNADSRVCCAGKLWTVLQQHAWMQLSQYGSAAQVWSSKNKHTSSVTMQAPPFSQSRQNTPV